MKDIILASASKRRSQILTSCGITHIVVPSKVKELVRGDRHVSETVLKNAEKKAEAVASSSGPAVVIGADTLVAHGEDIIGKPKDEGEARMILSKFSGGDIEVYTGICVIDVETGKRASGTDCSEVRVEALDEKKVEKYFSLLGPYDKAGGFSIEGVGSMIFDDIKGSYFNILGLSMIKLKELFSEASLDILDFVDPSLAVQD